MCSQRLVMEESLPFLQKVSEISPLWALYLHSLAIATLYDLMTLACPNSKSFAAGFSLCSGESVSTHPGNQQCYHGNPITEQNTIIGMLLKQAMWSVLLHNFILILCHLPRDSPQKRLQPSPPVGWSPWQQLQWDTRTLASGGNPGPGC